MISEFLHDIKQWIFPSYCCICDEKSPDSEDICSFCKPLLPWHQWSCYRCGLNMDSQEHSVYCEHCLEKPPAFDRLCALFNYDPPVRHLITKLKFGRQLAYGRILGKCMSEQIALDWYKKEDLPQAIIPVPLHLARLRKRGYNQALEISKPILKDFPFILLNNVCERSRFTHAQSRLRRDSRRMNLNHAFTLKKRLKLEHVAIIDDVVTTASTVNALAHILKKAGVARVDVWCICRA